MASSDTKTKTEGATKTEASPKSESAPSDSPSKAEGSAPAGYSRDERQKPISKAYRDNWTEIFGKKKKR